MLSCSAGGLYETMLVWDTEEFSDPVMAEFATIWRPLEKIVFSATLTSVEGSNRLATGTLEEEIGALGDRRIAVGGAGLAAECMRRGLVDEFELFVVPVAVGGGTPYFPPDVDIGLELVETPHVRRDRVPALPPARLGESGTTVQRSAQSAHRKSGYVRSDRQ